MVNKPQPRQFNIDHSHDDPFQIRLVLKQHVKSGSTLLLALSGGVDSVVLLHQLNALRERMPFELHAMYVHHGLSPNAEQWAAHCQWLCQQLQIPFTIARVAVTKQGKGTEAAARQARYDALFAYTYQFKQPDWIVTAHHQDDQAETFLLQLLRGSGVKGLSGMSVASDQRVLRPLLDVTREAILSYAKQHQLSWCEDESNLDLNYDRNFIRRTVVPDLKARYPSLASTLSRTATQMAEGQMLLTALAQQDATNHIDDVRLNIAGLSVLSDLRFHNVLRFWFDSMGLKMPSRTRLIEIANQLRHAKSDATVQLKHENHLFLRYDGYAYCYQVSEMPEFVRYDLTWQGEDQLILPNGVMVNFEHVNGGGIALKYLSIPLLIKSREGGERLKLYPDRPEKPLKQWFQSAKVPPWCRELTPLLYLADQLVCVPGIGVENSFAALDDQPGLMITVDFVKNRI